jgi:hypothetical protein
MQICRRRPQKGKISSSGCGLPDGLIEIGVQTYFLMDPDGIDCFF